MTEHTFMVARRPLVALAGVLFLTGSALRAEICLAQPAAEDALHGQHVLRAADYDAHTFVPPPVVPSGKYSAPAADINVSYSGFTEEARAAFAYAVSIWEEHLRSPVTIHVDATFRALDEDVLGSAGPRVTANFSQSAVPDTWYATALADAIASTNIGSGASDIQASFNSDFDNWYFGTDGRTPSGQFDFVTVVLHELGHGLGFTGSFDVADEESGQAFCGATEMGDGCWGLLTNDGRQRFPLIYDRFIEDAQDIPLLNTNVYPNPSRVLGDVLQSGAVFFDGDASRIVHADVPVDLFAPDNFEPGTSFSHLDEQRFPPGDPNSLMTPFLGRAEAVHSPGAITCAIFFDIGWTIADACESLFFIGLSEIDAAFVGDEAVITFEIETGAIFDSVAVEMSAPDAPFEHVETVDVDPLPQGPRAFEVRIPLSEPGQYRFRLRAFTAGIDALLGPELTVVVPLREPFLVRGPFPNPFPAPGGSPELQITVGDDQHVRVDVYNALGRRVLVLYDANLHANDRLRLDLDFSGLASGIYFIRIHGEEFQTVRGVAYSP